MLEFLREWKQGFLVLQLFEYMKSFRHILQSFSAFWISSTHIYKRLSTHLDSIFKKTRLLLSGILLQLKYNLSKVSKSGTIIKFILPKSGKGKSIVQSYQKWLVIFLTLTVSEREGERERDRKREREIDSWPGNLFINNFLYPSCCTLDCWTWKDIERYFFGQSDCRSRAL